LGNRIQHALRAYTPAEIKKIEAAAESFRPNPAIDTKTAITELATGEALISCLDEEGRPGIVERAFILPPQSQFGTIGDESRKKLIASSALYGKYERTLDRESAFEQLQNIAEEEKNRAMELEQITKTELESRKQTQNTDYNREQWDSVPPRNKTTNRGYRRQTPLEKATNAVFSTIGREVGKTLIRGILGSLKK